MAETFGYETKGTVDLNPRDNIRACKFTSGSAGTLEKLTVYLQFWSASPVNVKCAIYDSALNLVENGETEAKVSPTDQDDWMDFSFAVAPSVSASSVYYLAVWADDYIKAWRIAGDTNQLPYKSWNYGSWPSPLDPTAYFDFQLSIYATYEEAPPPAVKALVQATLISIPPLIVLPTLGQILKLTGGC